MPNVVIELLKVYFILFTAVMVNIIIHEAGHLIFGLITGYRFLSFRIFNIMLLKNKDGFRIKKYSIPGTGGQCIMIPPDFTEDYPCVLYNLGGIITGFIFGVFCLYMTLVFDYSWFFISTIIAFLFVLLNGIPFKGIIQNDAKNIVDLVNSSDNKRAFYNMLKVEEGLANDFMIADLPEELFALELSCENNTFAINNEMIRYSRIFATKDFEKALEYNNRLCENDIMPLYKSMLVLDKAFLMILKGEDKEEIKELLDKSTVKIMKAMKYEYSMIRNRYAIEKYVYCDEKKAAKTLKHFESLSKNPYKKGEYIFEKSMIKKLN